MNFVLPGGPLSQLSNASFFLAAVFGDLLLLRFFLTMAYVFLFVSALLGQPRWPSVSSTNNIFLDSVIWAALSGTLHMIALVRLLSDERRIKFKKDDEEQLWRFFYRRSGMGRLEMKQVLKYGHWRRVKAGEVILDPLAACSHLCLLVEGVANFTVTVANPKFGAPVLAHRLVSGCFFDMRLMNVLGLYIGFEGFGAQKWFAAVAKTDCLLYEWTMDELNTMATQCSPAVSHAWRNLLATQIGITLAWREIPDLPPASGTGESESPAILLGVRSRDFTDPLRGYEGGKKDWTVRGLMQWAIRSFHPFMPPGMRHNDLPVHGIMARNRMVALKDSQLRAAARAEAEDGWMVEEEEVSTLQVLRKMESLRLLEKTDVVKLAKDISVRRSGRAMIFGGDSSIRSDPGPRLPPRSP